ncbi:hypothetical protein [Enterococcus timonensis]|uniref:hypothetical protein n=1 Tax=Enterococcus timonensis TaxID=1852364 RepID=UPI0008DA7519|nr:hypothetical protein [Enterococcus timonensis]
MRKNIIPFAMLGALMAVGNTLNVYAEPLQNEANTTIQVVETKASATTLGVSLVDSVSQSKAFVTLKEDVAEKERIAQEKAEAEKKAAEEKAAAEQAAAEQAAAAAKAQAEKEAAAAVEAARLAASQSSQSMSLSTFLSTGVVNSGGYKFTYYSQSVLPGGGLSIPGRHVNSNGYVCDGDGYIVAASSLPKGTIIATPFGNSAKVYDRGTVGNHIDIYIR